MSNARGDRAVLLSRLQTAFGTAESAGDGDYYKLPFYSMNVVPSGELENDEAIYGDAYPGDAVAGLRSLAGALEVPLGLASLGWHLRALLGAPTTTGSTDYTHVFQTAALPTPALLTQCVSHLGVNKHFVQDSLAYTSMEIAARKNGQRQRVTFNMAGREEVGVSATRDTTPVSFTDQFPIGFQGALKVDDSAAAGIIGASLTLGSGVEPDQETLNGLSTAAQMDWGMWDLSGSIEARFRDRTYYDLADAGTAFKLNLDFVISGTRQLSIELPAVLLERTGIPVDGRGIISSSFNIRPARPASGAVLFKATLKNAVATYANPA